MRQIRETLRLHLQAELSYSEVGRALKISKSAVGKYVSLARVAGVDWATAQTLSDEALEARLYRPALPRSSHQQTPDFAVVHQELKRAGVTLMLLWEEYATGNPLGYKDTSFCVKYAEFARCQKRSMRQIHIAGEKLFVDYAGSTVPIVDAATGEITQAQIFVATLGASSYTFACATPRQTTADWIGAQVRALEFIGGVPRLIVPDQTHPFKKLPGCRRSAFESLDAPVLRPLPAQAYAISRWKTAKVNIDYHVEFEAHYYSVPHRLVGARIEVRVTGNLLECFASNQRSVTNILKSGMDRQPSLFPATSSVTVEHENVRGPDYYH
jgi:transposase